ncbi:MAG: LemA family protein [Bacteroidetes bacterium]|uniref:LemA family protein n=1 Tax=unclassified Chitinophaga TaxID=2619133 RepID=UPI0009D4A46D|nr:MULTISPECIES: LemA family protein [unclassified Chitinophaga]MBP1651883.1 LemA family protein [Bacteroidota bacterium]OMP76971.1 LemA family protein [[Flexibacter] sp. ATCC 35208]WPV69320.1 LemA family protein [Chitinophaga sp. LS1]
MKKSTLTLIIILVVVLIFGGCGVSKYNSIVRQDQAVKSKWSNVEAQYQRRADLIPNLVSTVKGAANFEKETLTQVMEARAKATQITIKGDDLTPEKVQQYQAAQGQLSTALGRLLAVSEAYPELKANQNFRDLQAQLEGTENRITVARNDFSTAVESFNSTVSTFPNNIVAGFGGFKAKEYYMADKGSENAPKVQF